MNAFDELKLKVYDSELDWNEKENIVNLMESCDDDDLQEICESVEAMLITEGATNDMNDLFKEFKKEVPKLVKIAKKDYKSKKYSDAIEKLERAKSLTEKADIKLKSVDAGTVGAIVCGRIYQGFATSIKAILLGLCTFGVGFVVVNISDTIKQITGIIDELKDEKNLSPSMLNSRYTKINGTIKSTLRHIDKMIDAIKTESKNADN